MDPCSKKNREPRPSAILCGPRRLTGLQKGASVTSTEDVEVHSPPRKCALWMPGRAWPWLAPLGHATMHVDVGGCKRGRGNGIMKWILLLIGLILGLTRTNSVWAVDDQSPLIEKAAYLQQVLLDRHWLDGL